MNRKFIGPSVEESIRNLKKKDPALRMAVEQYKAKQKMGLFLRIIREKEGLSQHGLARKSGVAQPAISRIESPASTVMPRFDLIIKLLAAMGYHLVFNAEKTPLHSRLAA